MHKPASLLSSLQVLLAHGWMSEASWTIPTHPLDPAPAGDPGDLQSLVWYVVPIKVKEFSQGHPQTFL